MKTREIKKQLREMSVTVETLSGMIVSIGESIKTIHDNLTVIEKFISNQVKESKE